MSALEESLRAVFKLPAKGSKTIPEIGVPFEPRPIEPMNPLRPFDRFRQPKIETRTPTMFDGSPIPEGMTLSPIMTMEYRDANQNGIEDRSEGLYLPQDLIPISDMPPKMNYPDAFFADPRGALSNEDMATEKETLKLRPSVPAPADFNLFRPAITDMEQDDPEEQKTLRGLLEQAEARNQAPLGEMANILQSAGTGEDTILAHLTPGEVILDPRFFEDPKFEAEVERKFRETGLDPEAYTAGSGIANLNVETGVPEYGFFKKIGKKLKKVVKKVAPIASFIPGVGTALGGVLGGIGGFATKIPGIGGALGKIGSTVAGGIANLGIPGISSIAGGTAGGFGGIQKALTTKAGLLGGGMFGETGSMYAGGPEAGKGLANMIGMGSGTAGQVEAYQQAQKAQAALAGLTPEEMAAMDPKQLQQLQNIAAGGASTGFMSNVGSLFGGGAGAGTGGGGGFGGGGFGNFAKMAGIGALSAGLGKLAYEDAQKQKGVGLTPLVTMSPTGRYNIEAEIARRMGQARPNPVEFGLLPEGTIPQLSGGQPRMAAMGGAIEDLTGGMARGMMRGGIMAFAQGGAVAMQEGGEMDPKSFPRMDGDINGLGTEQSDDIPAMLSDGEFVMTARAVRGAGSYEMQTEPGGIINLVPSLEEDRERGMDVMYKVMDTFSGQANPS
jgi:hypothetical protein